MILLTTTLLPFVLFKKLPHNPNVLLAAVTVIVRVVLVLVLVAVPRYISLLPEPAFKVKSLLVPEPPPAKVRSPFSVTADNPSMIAVPLVLFSVPPVFVK